ncbi:MAG: phosphoenolpyruvate--protein phosphotransferase [Elusimicrobiota bacterium]|nr:phosphoenolpyruvate--protein phosphotransferase [Elusimicrobiota bacterium]
MVQQNENIILKGVAASSGIVIGKVFLLENDDFVPIDDIKLSEDERDLELKRFEGAIIKTREAIKMSYKKINEALGENYAKIADAHLLMLEDPVMRKAIVDMIKSGIKAEYAVYKTTDDTVRAFEAVEDEYFKERIYDIKDVSKEIIFNLLGKKGVSLENIPKDYIIVAHNLTPADTISIKEKFIQGFATDMGGKTSHVAIVANTLEIPAVVGLKSISSTIKMDDTIILDGNKGLVILNPDKKTIENYKKEISIWLSSKKELEKLRNLPAQTIDNHIVEIFGNIDSPEEVNSILDNSATGIGLYRTEFLYFNRASIPTEQDHYEAYLKVVKSMGDFPTTIRTIDLGGDKISAYIGTKWIGQEKNPFMGLRAIRLCLKYQDIFISQLRGILRASAYGKINLLYPMISGIDELREANKILEKVKSDLRKEKIPFDENIKTGVMIEIPSAAMIADILAQEVDFFSIGTNDLIQYSLAVDRVNENVANLYDPFHPAILRFLKIIIDGGHKAGIKVAMCGEMAGDPAYTSVLLGLGLDEFSVSASQILKVKKVIRNVKMDDMKKIAEDVLNCKYRDEISQIIKKIQFIEREN